VRRSSGIRQLGGRPWLKPRHRAYSPDNERYQSSGRDAAKPRDEPEASASSHSWRLRQYRPRQDRRRPCLWRHGAAGLMEPVWRLLGVIAKPIVEQLIVRCENKIVVNSLHIYHLAWMISL
jgi:hypothetical protein